MAVDSKSEEKNKDNAEAQRRRGNAEKKEKA